MSKLWKVSDLVAACPSAPAVCFAILQLCRLRKQKQLKVSGKTLQKLSGISRKTRIRALKALRQGRWIVLQHQPVRDNSGVIVAIYYRIKPTMRLIRWLDHSVKIYTSGKICRTDSTYLYQKPQKCPSGGSSGETTSVTYTRDPKIDPLENTRVPKTGPTLYERETSSLSVAASAATANAAALSAPEKDIDSVAEVKWRVYENWKIKKDCNLRPGTEIQVYESWVTIANWLKDNATIGVGELNAGFDSSACWSYKIASINGVQYIFSIDVSPDAKCSVSIVCEDRSEELWAVDKYFLASEADLSLVINEVYTKAKKKSSLIQLLKRAIPGVAGNTATAGAAIERSTPKTAAGTV
jgi:hypothetical protein